MGDLYSQVREYFVYREDHSPVIGVAALHIFWEDVGEIRSVAVLTDFQSTGIGTRLVKQCIAEAAAIGMKRVFVLTTRPGFFERLGFQIVPTCDLPNHIWSECINCLKYPDKCNEIPMLLDLTASDSGD
jgi:amino-acid N-acetyltransferase